MLSKLGKIVFLLLLLPVVVLASKVYITAGSFDKNSKSNEEFCKKSDLKELKSVLSQYSCKDTGLISKSARGMQWYKCTVDNKAKDLLVTYTSTSFDCKTKSYHALSKQREYKNKPIPKKKRYFVTRGTLEEDEATSYCKEIPKDEIRSLTYKNDCADYTSKIRKYTSDIEFHKCDRGDDIYITKEVADENACRDLNTKVAILKNPNAKKEFFTVGSLDESKSTNLQTYCKQNTFNKPAIIFLEEQLDTKCTQEKFSSVIEYKNKNLKKYMCGTGTIHITYAGTKGKCRKLNAKADKKIMALEFSYKVEQERIAAAKREAKRVAEEKAKQERIAAEKLRKAEEKAASELALAKSHGFNSYVAYQQDLAQKAEAARLARIAAIKQAEDNVSPEMKEKFKYLDYKRYCKGPKDSTCYSLNEVYKYYQENDALMGWMSCKGLKFNETDTDNRKIVMANDYVAQMCKRLMNDYMQYNLRQYGKSGIGQQDLIDMNWITNRAKGRF